MTYCTKVVVYETITVDESLSRESSFPVGSEVLHICRVRSVDDKPLILDVNYFLKSAVPGLTKEIAENSIYTYLEQELKMQIVTSKRKITVEKATPQDRELIFMDSYNCLAVVTSNTFNSDGVMFEYAQSRHQPEYFFLPRYCYPKESSNLTNKRLWLFLRQRRFLCQYFTNLFQMYKLQLYQYANS